MGIQKALIGFIWIKFMNWAIAASIMKTSNNIVCVSKSLMCYLYPEIWKISR